MNKCVICDLCNAAIPPHAHYVVRIDVFADPAMPDMSGDELAESAGQIEKLLDEMKSMSEQELTDQVHRRFEYKICRSCQRKFLANPLGKPRRQTLTEN